MPLNRAAALAGVNRITAWRWQTEGAAEIDAGDDDDELGMLARFSLDYGAARAAYLLELSEAWKEAVVRKDGNVAKAIQTMMAAISPDEFSERRATRSINQTTTLAGEIGVSRFGSMSAEELTAEREMIQARHDAAAPLPADDWRSAVVQLPGPAGGDSETPAPSEKKTPVPGKPESGSRTRKSGNGALPARNQDFPRNISPTRARSPYARAIFRCAG